MPADILVVEDDPLAGAAIQDMLQDRGYKVELVTDGAGLVEVVKTLAPRVVVLDILLPGSDGLSLCRALKRDPLTSEVKVLMVTGKSFIEDQARASAAGASGFVHKTSGARNIAEAVAALAGPAPAK